MSTEQKKLHFAAFAEACLDLALTYFEQRLPFRVCTQQLIQTGGRTRENLMKTLVWVRPIDTDKKTGMEAFEARREETGARHCILTGQSPNVCLEAGAVRGKAASTHSQLHNYEVITTGKSFLLRSVTELWKPLDSILQPVPADQRCVLQANATHNSPKRSRTDLR